MAVTLVVTDDHTQDVLQGATPDDVTLIQVGDLRWQAYLSEDSLQKLEQTVREFLNGMDPLRESRKPAKSRPRESATPLVLKAAQPSQIAGFDPTPEERQEQRDKIREWCATHERAYLRDQQIGPKGRIPRRVVSAFYAEHPLEPKIFATE